MHSSAKQCLAPFPFPFPFLLYAGRLDPARFRQVHRSHIVNLDAVAHLKPYDERRLAITLKDGTVVVASRAASEELRRLAR
jgi:two-component system LytT family response regulator